MSVKKAYHVTIILLLIVIIGIGYKYINTEQPVDSGTKNVIDPMEPPFNPVELGIYLGEKTEVGNLTILKAKVTQNGNPDVIGYGKVYGIQKIDVPYPVGYAEIFILDQENQLVPHPLNLKINTLALELNNVLNSEEICVTGELYNCSAWDGSWFLALKLDNQYIYSVKTDPKPLTDTQVALYTDSEFYHVNDTARVTIRNLSEDWLEVGRSLRLYKDVNGSWIETQPYPDDYLVTNELYVFFPGYSWSHKLPLHHLTPGYYRLVKQVSHYDSPEIEVETHFTVTS